MKFGFNEQEQRRAKIYAQIRNCTRQYFNAEGKWVYSEKPTTGRRELICWALASLADEESFSLGEGILDHGPSEPLDAFGAVACLQIVFRYGDKLSKKTKNRLLKDLKAYMPRSVTRDFVFQGYNDNAPAMASFIALGCGQLFDNKQATLQGRTNLYALCDLLRRRGSNSEFLSPNYAPVTLLPIAEIVNWIKDKEARKLALKCETHMWTDLLTHFHLPTSRLSGPHSRAYMPDSVGHLSNVNMLFHHVFGDKIFVNPLTMFFPLKPKQVIIHDLAYMTSQCSWTISADYHLQPKMNQLLKKSYPYSVLSTAEIGTTTFSWESPRKPFDYDTGAHAINLTSYMTEDYAVGTSSRQFHDGAQTDIWRVTYKRRENPKTVEHTNTAFIRYMINDRRPGQENIYPGGKYQGSQLLVEEGRALSIQYKDLSLCLYRPRFTFIEKISSLKVSIIFPEHYGRVKYIWMGQKRVSDLPAKAKEPVDVFIKDGRIQMGIRPVRLKDHGCKTGTSIERINDYLVISFYNYSGKPRSFTPDELMEALNGVLLEVKSIEDMGFQKFRKRFTDYQLFDTMYGNRIVRVKADSVELGLIYSPINQHIKAALINGKLRDEGVHLEAKGIRPEFLPLLQDGRSVDLDQFFTLYRRPEPT